MHTSQDIASIVDRITAQSRARFGHGLWFMEDGGVDAGSGDSGGAAGDSGGTAGDTGGTADDQGQQDQGGQGSSDGKVEDLPEWAQKQIRDARAEAGKARTDAKTKAADEATEALTKKLLAALGKDDDGKTKVTPEELAKQLGETRSEANQTKIELAVYRTAGKHQGDPDALLDSRGFLAKLTDLDPTAKDFTAKVETAIKDAVKDNPKLKVAQAAGSSSADHGAGGSGEQQTRTPKSLADAVGGHYGT